MEPITHFVDINFKLAVINHLMYERCVLGIKFDVYDFAKRYALRKIDVEVEGFDAIPEVKQYFAEFPILSEHLQSIEHLEQEGGDPIYTQVCPFWSGEDDLFNIRSAEDSVLFPHLKTVTLFFDDNDEILAGFRRRGIQADWS